MRTLRSNALVATHVELALLLTLDVHILYAIARDVSARGESFLAILSYTAADVCKVLELTHQ